MGKKNKRAAIEATPAEMQAAPIDVTDAPSSLALSAAKARAVVPHLVWSRALDEETGAAIMALADHADPQPPPVDDAPESDEGEDTSEDTPTA